MLSEEPLHPVDPMVSQSKTEAQEQDRKEVEETNVLGVSVL